MLVKIFALAILTEAIVELIFKAAPLQGSRAWLIKKTPWLRSELQGHLLECKYCTSIWIAPIVFGVSAYLDVEAVRFLGAALIVARISNYAHLLYSTVLDIQINKRLERK